MRAPRASDAPAVWPPLSANIPAYWAQAHRMRAQACADALKLAGSWRRGILTG